MALHLVALQLARLINTSSVRTKVLEAKVYPYDSSSLAAQTGLRDYDSSKTYLPVSLLPLEKPNYGESYA